MDVGAPEKGYEEDVGQAVLPPCRALFPDRRQDRLSYL